MKVEMENNRGGGTNMCLSFAFILFLKLIQKVLHKDFQMQLPSYLLIQVTFDASTIMKNVLNT